MKVKFITVFLCSLVFLGCTNKKLYGEDSVQIRINRFDTDLFHFLENKNPEEFLEKTDTAFLNLFGDNIISIGKIDSSGFFNRLTNYFSEPTLRNLYKEEQEKFISVSGIEKELSKGFSILISEIPHIIIPELYMHVSGLSQNVIAADQILSISADKYLGNTYSLYEEFFYDYQREQMTPERIVPDYLLGFLMSEFPFDPQQNTLLERMLYEGKLRYILYELLPEREPREALGYTEDEYNWCKKSESRIWKTLQEKKHLYITDYLTISQYINEAAYTSPLTSSSPGRVGIFTGYEIIRSFMKNNPGISWSELMTEDSQNLLKKAKYKP